ncbi:MAG: hypothetical protein E7598_04685 [Ruminococcaceae bacterium]|nr:hypothetical protein [Oscillospiraceae bacterium]
MYENDFCEYAVEKKKEGSYLAKIVLAVAAAIVAAFVIFTILIPRYGFVGLLAAVLAIALFWYLSRFTYIECEYSQSGAFLDFSYVYSKQYRRDKLSVDLKKCAKKIAPYTGKFEGFNVKDVLDMRSSATAANSYMLVFEDNDGTHAVLFDATKRLVNNLYHQVPSLVTVSKELPEE